MKRNKINRIACPSLVTLAVAVFTLPVQADLLLYEPFDYAVGTGLGGDQGGTAAQPVGYTNASSGTAWSAHQVGAEYNSAEDALLTAGSLSYANLATAGNSVNHGSGAAGAQSKYATAINLPTPINRPASGTSSVYMSFLVRQNSFVQNTPVTEPPTAPGPGNRFGFAEFSANTITPNGLALNADAQSNSTVAMPGTVWMRPDITSAAEGTPEPSTHTQFGVGKSSGDGINAAGTATWQRDNDVQANPLNDQGSTRQGAEKVPWQNQTYFIVAKYTFNDPIWDARMDPFATPGTRNSQEDSVSIFINPLPADLGDNAGEASAAMTALYSATGGVGGLTADSNTIASFVLLGHRQGTGGANNNTSAAYSFDELRIGTTWADVTPTAAAGQPGDHNDDGYVDAADYVAWRKLNIGGPGGYDDFYENFGEPPSGSAGGGAIPEPSGFVLLGATVLFAAIRRRTAR
jgi:hypothetical protein